MPFFSELCNITTNYLCKTEHQVDSSRPRGQFFNQPFVMETFYKVRPFDNQRFFCKNGLAFLTMTNEWQRVCVRDVDRPKLKYYF